MKHVAINRPLSSTLLDESLQNTLNERMVTENLACSLVNVLPDTGYYIVASIYNVPKIQANDITKWQDLIADEHIIIGTPLSSVYAIGDRVVINNRFDVSIDITMKVTNNDISLARTIESIKQLGSGQNYTDCVKIARTFIYPIANIIGTIVDFKDEQKTTV